MVAPEQGRSCKLMTMQYELIQKFFKEKYFFSMSLLFFVKKRKTKENANSASTLTSTNPQSEFFDKSPLSSSVKSPNKVRNLAKRAKRKLNDENRRYKTEWNHEYV